ncbi:hypothetical protein IV203_005997 [Nitzschia inconspicua]|uniref:Uncharacterized protein n=1 Tax=Nitzschia inconspicua TaxID=303405 RepID=A0A9K3KND4_9STRA|nr:hypothetical protein IV203_005997 [Nitzschia inconspicua]
MSQEKRVWILDSLPSVAQSSIGPMLDAVFECELGAAKKPKRTKGISLSSLTLRTGTIRKYLIAAASLIAIFDSDPGRVSRKEKGSDSLCSPLEKVLKEQKRSEDVPDRWERWTVGLHFALMKKYSHLPFRGKHLAITDWFVVALHGGFRRAEWAQDRSHTKLNQTRTECPQRSGGSPELAISVTVHWRMQKNGDHGEKKLFTRNDEDDRLCCVHHWIRIIRRFVDMQGFTSNVPSACYWSQYHDQSFYITSTDIETAMRYTAAEYYELDSFKHKDIPTKFLAHSLRVGACIILQAMGFESHQIQQMLRWKSETWLMYTRNLHVVSKQQNEAVFKASLLKVM